jgi:hypothetical protein
MAAAARLALWRDGSDAVEIWRVLNDDARAAT